MSGREQSLVSEAFQSNWIAPLGPHVDAFEREFCERVGSPAAAALSSGTAALHLALKLVGVRAGDDVMCSSFSFIASANPIAYEGARPVFVDSEERSWNMDPALLCEGLERAAARGRLPAAVVVVHLYGQSADLDPIQEACDRHGVPLIEDAAESMGATYRGRHTGTFGRFGVYSFNGNKIITTSGGGMLASTDAALVQKARHLATQARDPAPHYQHSEIGYNYRLSNICAAIGRGQLEVLTERVERRRAIFEWYQQALDLPGIAFMPEAPYGRCNRWLTCILIDPARFGADREQVRTALEAANIEARPLWKPLHLQPVFSGCTVLGGRISAGLFERGLCLPSGTAMTDRDLERVAGIVRALRRPWSAGI
jgi:pyridoxal phosphate-dependent aminotransferase EpsN